MTDNIWGFAGMVITMFGAAIAFMFKLNESKNTKRIATLEGHFDECLKDRNRIRLELLEVKLRLDDCQADEKTNQDSQ